MGCDGTDKSNGLQLVVIPYSTEQDGILVGGLILRVLII